MDAWLFAAALASAFLHAAWNAAIKAHPQPRQAMAAQMVMAAVLCVPGVWWAGLPPGPAWPWLLLSTAMNTGTVLALLKAYEHGAFGTVYPIARASAVLGVAAVAPLLLGERLSATAMLGVALVVAALGLLALDTRRAGAQALHGRALMWTLAAGAFIAACVLADAQGVRRSDSALSYGFAVSIVNAIVMSWINRSAGPPWAVVRACARVAVPASFIAMASYLLILWVFRHAPVAPASALRDTSAVFAMLIAVLWLKEPLHRGRLAVLLLAVAGVPLLRLG